MEKKGFSFKPQLSFDGIAIILAVIALAVWVGGLKTTVDNHTQELADHETRLRDHDREINMIQREASILHSPKQIP